MFFVVMSPGKLRRIIAAAYEKGIDRGYGLGKQLKYVETTNKGLFLSNKVDKDIKEILEREGM